MKTELKEMDKSISKEDNSNEEDASDIISYIDDSEGSDEEIHSEGGEISLRVPEFTVGNRIQLPIPESVERLAPSWLKQRTVTDAGPIIRQESLVDTTVFSKPVQNPANTAADDKVYVTVNADDEEYDMNHPKRGMAVIFNNENFEDKVQNKTRFGSMRDVERLTETFQLFGFEVVEHKDLTYDKLTNILKQLSEDDHTESDCLAIIVLSHGDHGQVSYIKTVDGGLMPTEKLWTQFTPDKCRSLIGKPKLFFIQACRGKDTDLGVKVQTRRRSRIETDSAEVSFKIPTHADFLIACSTSSGYVSFRDTVDGSWYIQTLCNVLRDCHQTDDILKMLTKTARTVAFKMKANNEDSATEDNGVQVPSFTSMLTRNLYLKPK